MSQPFFAVESIPPYQTAEFRFSYGWPGQTEEQLGVVHSHFAQLNLEKRLVKDYAVRFRTLWHR